MILLASGCATTSPDSQLAPFTSDGCTLFRTDPINEADWCECCIAHDIAYWKGGTREERLEADQALKSCVEAKTGNPELAKLMYEGVRVGGSPYFYNLYHWGHGWGYQGEYRELSLADEAQALLLLTDFRSDDYEKICPSN